jgi:hypothetical protein
MVTPIVSYTRPRKAGLMKGFTFQFAQECSARFRRNFHLSKESGLWAGLYIQPTKAADRIGKHDQRGD